MSTDKTLADVQPGGRVRLGDRPFIETQARELLAMEWEKLSFDAPVEELRAGCELPPVIAAGVRAIVAALSAHPSPDSQRDDSDLLAGLRDVEEHLYYAGSNPSHTETVRAAINALSAQPSPGETLPPEMRLGSPDYLDYLDTEPSPGGQGDWRAMLSQFGEDNPREGSRSNGHDGVDHNDWVDHAEVPVDVLARIAAALAARQPVSETDAYQQGFRDGQDRTCTVAARQPVGEPEIWVSPGQLEELKRRPAGQGSNYLPTRLASEGNFTQPLYAVLTAQAVDLGELREMLVSWKNCDYPFSYEGQCAQRALNACIADLQGWVDSQAVGK